MSGLTVHVVAGNTVGASSVSVTGSVQHVITDQEVSSFGLTDAALKGAVGKYFGQNPDDAFLHSSTPWGDLYKTYNWPQVQTVLTVASATITGITSEPQIIAQQSFQNHSNVEGSFNVHVSTSVSTTTETNWTETSTISISDQITYTVGVPAEESLSEAVTMSYSQAFGQGGSQSTSTTVGADQAVTVELKPGESVNAELTASKGVMNIRIVYKAVLMGDVAINYSGTYKGHHFWGLNLPSVMAAAGISNSMTITEDIEVGFFTNSSVTLSNPQGQPVKSFAARSPSVPTLAPRELVAH